MHRLHEDDLAGHVLTRERWEMCGSRRSPMRTRISAVGSPLRDGGGTPLRDSGSVKRMGTGANQNRCSRSKVVVEAASASRLTALALLRLAGACATSERRTAVGVREKPVQNLIDTNRSALTTEEPQMGDTPKSTPYNAVRSFKQAPLPPLGFRRTPAPCSGSSALPERGCHAPSSRGRSTTRTSCSARRRTSARR